MAHKQFKMKGHNVKSTSILLASLFFAATTSIASAVDENKAIATVNGTKITEGTLMRYADQRGLPAEMPNEQQRKTLIEELINRELIYQNAVDTSPCRRWVTT